MALATFSPNSGLNLSKNSMVAITGINEIMNAMHQNPNMMKQKIANRPT